MPTILPTIFVLKNPQRNNCGKFEGLGCGASGNNVLCLIMPYIVNLLGFQPFLNTLRHIKTLENANYSAYQVYK